MKFQLMIGGHFVLCKLLQIAQGWYMSSKHIWKVKVLLA